MRLASWNNQAAPRVNQPFDKVPGQSGQVLFQAFKKRKLKGYLNLVSRADVTSILSKTRLN